MHKNYVKFKSRFLKPTNEESKDTDVSSAIDKHLLCTADLGEESMIWTKFEHESSPSFKTD